MLYSGRGGYYLEQRRGRESRMILNVRHRDGLSSDGEDSARGWIHRYDRDV
jgi:hypothetical protein